MINKEHLWFLTLFSLILVLSIYYITMPSDLLLSNQVFENENKTEVVNLDIEESDILTSLRLDLEEKREDKKKELQTILISSESTIEDKNNLLNVPKISQKKIEVIYNTLANYENSHQTIIYLCDIGFNSSEALYIYNTYRNNTLDKLSRDWTNNHNTLFITMCYPDITTPIKYKFLPVILMIDIDIQINVIRITNCPSRSVIGPKSIRGCSPSTYSYCT